MTTIHDLALEMQSFIKVAPSTLEEAKQSDINTDNHIEFSILVDAWAAGLYDEDPDLIVATIEEFLND